MILESIFSGIDLNTIYVWLGSLGAGGGLGWLLRSNRRKAAAEAAQKEVEARADEFELLRKQIDLNQQQNLDLLEQLGKKEDRFHEQTQKMREVQRELMEALEREKTHIRNEATLERERDHYKTWHCQSATCTRGKPDPQGRRPPNPKLLGLPYVAPE